MNKQYPFLLSSGEMLDYAADIYPITIEDISAGLASSLRTKGQADTLLSLLEHSIMVYKLVEAKYPEDYELQLHALLHDCEEAILADLPTNGKDYLNDLFPGFKDEMKKIRHKIISSLYMKHNIPLDPFKHDLEEVDLADTLAFFYEMGIQPESEYKEKMWEYILHKYPEQIEEDMPELLPGSLHNMVDVFYDLVTKLGGRK